MLWAGSPSLWHRTFIVIERLNLSTPDKRLQPIKILNDGVNCFDERAKGIRQHKAIDSSYYGENLGRCLNWTSPTPLRFVIRNSSNLAKGLATVTCRYVGAVKGRRVERFRVVVEAIARPYEVDLDTRALRRRKKRPIAPHHNTRFKCLLRTI